VQRLPRRRQQGDRCTAGTYAHANFARFARRFSRLAPRRYWRDPESQRSSADGYGQRGWPGRASETNAVALSPRVNMPMAPCRCCSIGYTAQALRRVVSSRLPRRRSAQNRHSIEWQERSRVEVEAIEDAIIWQSQRQNGVLQARAAGCLCRELFIFFHPAARCFHAAAPHSYSIIVRCRAERAMHEE